MEFTKGKWFLSPNQIEVGSSNGIYIADCGYALDVTIDRKECIANALLISKAPEMLEMLKELRQIFDKYSVCFESQFFKYKEPIEQLIKEATEIK